MPKTRIVMIGGFLGAGKTTAIARLARHYTDTGLSVAVVTNDQAFGLVDTGSLQSQGFEVGEVPGACFCCKFDDLVDTLAALGAERQPDIILTEPVGSCTDLVATVIEPLRSLHGDRYEVGRLAVLCKPEHGEKILSDRSAGFSPKAAYIFLKQLEEADAVVINKVDTLDADQAQRLAERVRSRFPGKPVLLGSGKRGDGFDELVEQLASPRSSRPAMDIDYDVYAEGEAELAWLNATAEATAPAPMDVDRLALAVVSALAEAAEADGFEPAHIKVLGFAGGQTCVANLVSSDTAAVLSLPSGESATTARLVINARVAGDPDRLAYVLATVLSRLADELQIHLDLASSQHFRPGRPVPTHRYA
ncbi:MAG: GTP-binding protein [Planctomycetota bacterium]